MIRYFNVKGSDGVETIDELDSSDFPNHRAFKKELRRLVHEYHLTQQFCYVSSRSTKAWRVFAVIL